MDTLDSTILNYKCGGKEMLLGMPRTMVFLRLALPNEDSTAAIVRSANDARKNMVSRGAGPSLNQWSVSSHVRPTVFAKSASVTFFPLVKYPEAIFASISTRESGGIRWSGMSYRFRMGIPDCTMALYFLVRVIRSSLASGRFCICGEGWNVHITH